MSKKIDVLSEITHKVTSDLKCKALLEGTPVNWVLLEIEVIPTEYGFETLEYGIELGKYHIFFYRFVGKSQIEPLVYSIPINDTKAMADFIINIIKEEINAFKI